MKYLSLIFILSCTQDVSIMKVYDEEKNDTSLTELETEISNEPEEESYEPMGAFLYGKLWDDIEDYDDEIDQDKIWEDDFYMETVREEVEQMRVDIEKVYLEDLSEQNK